MHKVCSWHFFCHAGSNTCLHVRELRCRLVLNSRRVLHVHIMPSRHFLLCSGGNPRDHVRELWHWVLCRRHWTVCLQAVRCRHVIVCNRCHINFHVRELRGRLVLHDSRVVPVHRMRRWVLWHKCRCIVIRCWLFSMPHGHVLVPAGSHLMLPVRRWKVEQPYSHHHPGAVRPMPSRDLFDIRHSHRHFAVHKVQRWVLFIAAGCPEQQHV